MGEFKIDFSKYGKPEVPQSEEESMTQELYEQQIEEEAEKLGTSLEKLVQDINADGGPEVVKKVFEEKGQKMLSEIDGDISNAKENKNRNYKFAVGATVAFIIAEIFADKVGMGVDDLYASLKNHYSPYDNVANSDTAAVGTMFTFFAALSAAGVVKSLSDAVKSWSREKSAMIKKNTQLLKAKIVGFDHTNKE